MQKSVFKKRLLIYGLALVLLAATCMSPIAMTGKQALAQDMLSAYNILKNDPANQVFLNRLLAAGATEAQVESLLNDLNDQVRASGPLTDQNFNRLMYNALEEVITWPKHKDISFALLDAFGEEIDHTIQNKKLHEDLIPLRNAVHDSLLGPSTPGDNQSGPGSGGGAPGTQETPDLNTSGSMVSIKSDALSRTTSNGVETVTVNKEIASQVETVRKQGKQQLELSITPNPGASSTNVIFPKEVIKSANTMGLTIKTPGFNLEIPGIVINSLARMDRQLSLTFAKGSATGLASQMSGVAGTEGATVVGTPIQIDTTLQGAITLYLPFGDQDLPPAGEARNQFLNSLAIFASHSDGSKEVLKGSIVKDANGRPSAVSCIVNKFSTFGIIQVPPKDEPPVDPPQEPVNLSDIKGHWAQASIIKLVQQGAISGYPNGTFMPDKTITRAEFASVLVSALNLKGTGGKVFADTAKHWARESIAIANARGIINGYNSQRFGPDDPITREQMALMIYQAQGLTSNVTGKKFRDEARISPWSRNAVMATTAAGIINGYPDGSFRPQGRTTRAEAATVIVNCLAK